MRDKPEISAKLEELRQTRSSIAQLSVFGDNNHVKLDAQISVLEDALIKAWTYMAIEEIVEKMQGDDYYLRQPENKAKLDAYDWLLGLIDEF